MFGNLVETRSETYFKCHVKKNLPLQNSYAQVFVVSHYFKSTAIKNSAYTYTC